MEYLTNLVATIAGDVWNTIAHNWSYLLTGPSGSRARTICGQATPWWCARWTGWRGPQRWSSRRSPGWGSAASTSRASLNPTSTPRHPWGERCLGSSPFSAQLRVGQQ